MRVDITTPDDDEILQTTRHKKFALDKSAQVAGAQKRTSPRLGKAMKSGLGSFRLVPVPFTNMRPRNPDFTDVLQAAVGECHGVDNDYLPPVGNGLRLRGQHPWVLLQDKIDAQQGRLNQHFLLPALFSLPR